MGSWNLKRGQRQVDNDIFIPQGQGIDIGQSGISCRCCLLFLAEQHMPSIMSLCRQQIERRSVAVPRMRTVECLDQDAASGL